MLLGLYLCFLFFFQAEDGIRDLVRSRGLGDVYKRQVQIGNLVLGILKIVCLDKTLFNQGLHEEIDLTKTCLLYTSDAADDLLCVDLGGRRIIKKKNRTIHNKRTKSQQQPINPYDE